MTIDEAIAECKENDLQQIAEWLEELKKYKESEFNTLKEDGQLLYNQGILDGYNKAIDDFVKEICKMIVQSENNGNYRFYAVEIKQAIADLAEQLKRGAENEQSI